MGKRGAIHVFLTFVALFWAHEAPAQPAPKQVPCATISPQAVTAVPAPFDAYMKLICFDTSGQGLVPPAGWNWVDGDSDVGLSSIDDRPGPNGQPRLSRQWYVSLTPQKISAAGLASLREVLAPAVQPQFIIGARIMELDALTSAGELKQEFMIFPANPAATHNIKLLLECHQFCRHGDPPWILGIIPAAKP
jgi:hypothetical protein